MHPARRTFFCFLEWGEQKKTLPESHWCQSFEIAATRTFGPVNLVFSRQTDFFFAKPMIITEPAVPTARLLSLGSKLYPSNMQHMLNKDFSRFFSIFRVHQNRESERKALMAGWLWCDASIFKANLHNVDKFQLDHSTLGGNLLCSSAE